MTDGDAERPKVLEFFSADVMSARIPGPDEPAYGLLQIKYKDENDRAAFESAAPTFLANAKTGIVAFENCGLNLTILEFAPGFVLPLHSHEADCLYYVEAGKIIMGSKELGPGEGFLARANQQYGYVAGPEGVRVIEFRNGFTLDFTLHQRNVSKWKEKLEEAVG